MNSVRTDFTKKRMGGTGFSPASPAAEGPHWGNEWFLEGEFFPLPTVACGALPPLLGLPPATHGGYPRGSTDLSFWEDRSARTDGRNPVKGPILKRA